MALIEQRQKSPASQRYIPPEQDVLPFVKDVAPPPRMPVPNDDDDDDDDESENKATPKRNRQGKRRPKRRGRSAFAHLTSRNVPCPADPEASCTRCGGALSVIGQATSFRVEWVPGHFVVDDVARDKCACPNCPGEGVLTVPAPYALPRAVR